MCVYIALCSQDIATVLPLQHIQLITLDYEPATVGQGTHTGRILRWPGTECDCVAADLRPSNVAEVRPQGEACSLKGHVVLNGLTAHE